MARSSFTSVMAHVLAVEGGYADDPRDPGGATNMGVTHRTLAAWLGVARVSRAAVRALDRTTAMAIYRARYWNLIWGDRLAAGIDLAVMDGAVHSGPARAVRWLQFAAGATPDGVMGPLTLAAQAAVRAEATIANMTLIRRRWLQRLDAWAIFGRGWSRRLRRTEARALELSRANPARDGTAVVVGTGPAASKAPDAQETARDIGVDPAVLPWWAALAIALAATLAIAWWHRAFIAERLARARDFIADLRAASRETVAHELCGVTIFQAFADLRARIAAEARAIPDQEAGSGGAATSTREE